MDQISPYASNPDLDFSHAPPAPDVASVPSAQDIAAARGGPAAPPMMMQQNPQTPQQSSGPSKVISPYPSNPDLDHTPSPSVANVPGTEIPQTAAKQQEQTGSWAQYSHQEPTFGKYLGAVGDKMDMAADVGLGAAEALTTGVTGTLGVLAGDIAGLAYKQFGGSEADAEATRNKIVNAVTEMPETVTGKDMVTWLGDHLAFIGRASDTLIGQPIAKFTDSPLVGQAASDVAQMAAGGELSRIGAKIALRAAPEIGATGVVTALKNPSGAATAAAAGVAGHSLGGLPGAILGEYVFSGAKDFWKQWAANYGKVKGYDIPIIDPTIQAAGTVGQLTPLANQAVQQKKNKGQ